MTYQLFKKNYPAIFSLRGSLFVCYQHLPKPHGKLKMISQLSLADSEKIVTLLDKNEN